MSRIAADRYNQLTPHLMYIISNKEARFRIIDAEVRGVVSYSIDPLGECDGHVARDATAGNEGRYDWDYHDR
jgi:hypothetical protein